MSGDDMNQSKSVNLKNRHDEIIGKYKAKKSINCVNLKHSLKVVNE